MGLDMEDTAFRNLVEDVRFRTDIVDVIGGDLNLTPCGSILKGRSPFNKDDTPSLVVWPETQTWHDFSGGGSNGGDCFEYVQRRDNCAFIPPPQRLADRAGITVPERTDVSPETAATSEDRRRLEAMLTMAADYYHDALPNDVRQDWLHNRYGLTDETIDRFRIGWADGGLFTFMTGDLGVTREEALSTGLFVVLDDGAVVDFFQGRIVFPYWKRGRVVYFTGRRTDRTPEKPWEDAKYRKLPGQSEKRPYISLLLSNDHFFNEDAARGADLILITEGITDCIAGAQAGLACISPATTRFRAKDHEKLLAITAKASKIVICNDSEISNAGETGAVETAAILYHAGRNVRLATIPRAAETDKIDVNDLVRTQGKDGLRRVVEAAISLPRFLVEKVPADTPKEDLVTALQPAIELVKDASELDRDVTSDLLQKRFGLRKASVRELLDSNKDNRHENGPRTTPAISTGPRKGEVFEHGAHYCGIGRGGETVILSSFTMKATRRIVVDGNEILETTITAENGRIFEKVLLRREAWLSKPAFLRSLPSVDLQWTGSDENVQGVLRLVASQDAPVSRGTFTLGYHDTDAGPRWVTAKAVVAPEEIPPDAEPILYIPSGSHLHERIAFPTDVSTDEEKALASVALSAILQLNRPEVVLPILGWFFATPLKPRLMGVFGHFPFLMVWGTQGSGKSSIISNVFWPLFGFKGTEPYSATETEFALIKLMSCTNSVPVFVDEYKPFDMPKHKLDRLHRLLRQIYDGEIEERGRPDQQVNAYRLSAPVVLAGETRPTEPALVERMLPVNPDKNALVTHPEYATAMATLRSLDLTKLTAGILRFLLKTDVDARVSMAREIADGLLEGRTIPPRVKDSIVIMIFGLRVFKEYAESRGVDIGVLQVDKAVTGILDDLLEAGGNSVKSVLDRFVEELHVMAVQGRILSGREYIVSGNMLNIHLGACHAAYTEHCRRIGYTGEVPDRMALRRQFNESLVSGGYVTAVDELVCFNGRQDRRRCVVIDLEKARNTLAIDDFPARSTGMVAS